MDTQVVSSVPKRPDRGPWTCLGLIAALTIIVTPVALPFWVSCGPTSYLQLPGVIMFLALAIVCTAAFIHCPVDPRWAKAMALILSLPSLFFAVQFGLMFVMFRLM